MSSPHPTPSSPLSSPISPPPPPPKGSKVCTLCHTPRNVLIRCQIGSSPNASTSSPNKWHFLCPGKCWREASGGQVDGDAAHPGYRYGGMWKNKHEGASARVKGKARGWRTGGKGTEGKGEGKGEEAEEVEEKGQESEGEGDVGGRGGEGREGG